MPKSHPPYPAEHRRRMVDMVRSGMSPEALARKLEPTAQAIRNWVAQADRDEGKRQDGLTTTEQEALYRLRREVKQLREEREILKKPRPRSHGRATRSRRSLRVREGESGLASSDHDVPSTGRLQQWLLRGART